MLGEKGVDDTLECVKDDLAEDRYLIEVLELICDMDDKYKFSNSLQGT